MTSQARKTKIVCTIGPASSSREMIRDLLIAGMDVARLNFSHGAHEAHAAVVTLLREEAKKQGRDIAIFADLQGPKIRTNDFEGGEITVMSGEEVRLIHASTPGQKGLITTRFAPLVHDAEVGDRILLNDGLVELKVTIKDPQGLTCVALKGGALKDRRGINLPGVKLQVPALTEKDLRDVAFACGLDIDFFALSFVREAGDVSQLKALIAEQGKDIQVIAKIEKPEAIKNLGAILEVADAVMVARGDLGVELGIERVPGVQKRMINEAIKHGVPVITATQMLESMITNPWPTRAEASDVANAVFDGSDAMMLSGETAVGDFPIETVRIMREIIQDAEAQNCSNHFDDWKILDSESSRLGMSIGKSARILAEQTSAVALACLSDTGNAAIRVTAQRPHIPVYMLSINQKSVRRMSLVRGAHGVLLRELPELGQVFPSLERALCRLGLIRKGDAVVYTASISLGQKAATNTIHVRYADEGCFMEDEGSIG